MKLGTAARIVKLAVTIAVFVIVTVPVILAVIPMVTSGNSPISLGMDAEYDLEYMDESVLKENLDNLKDKNDLIAYFGEDDWPMSKYSTAEIAHEAKKIGAETLIVKHSDGSPAQVESIAYGTILMTGVATGVKTEGLLSSISSIDFRYSTVSKDGKVTVPWNTEREMDNGNLTIGVTVPYVVLMASMACDSQVRVDVKVSYAGLMSVDVNLNAAFDYDAKGEYTHDEEINTITLTNLDGISVPVGYEGAIGMCDMIYTDLEGDEAIVIQSDSGKVSEVLRETFEADGFLTLSMGGEIYRMSGDMSEAFLTAIEYIEVNFHGE